MTGCRAAGLKDLDTTLGNERMTMRRRLVAALLLSVMIMGQPLFAQRYPAISQCQRIEMLRPPSERPVRMVLDTDTYNEIDDQFAVVYALISAYMVHHFWTDQDDMTKNMEMSLFMKNLSIAGGGLILFALASLGEGVAMDFTITDPVFD